MGFRSIVGRQAKVDNVHLYQVNENGSPETLIKDDFERQSLGSNWIKESISEHGTSDALRASIKNGVLVLNHQGGKKDTWVRSKRSFSFQGETTVFEFTLVSRAPHEHNPAIVLGTEPYQPGETSHVLLSDVGQQSPGFNFAMIDGQWRSDQVSEQTSRANQKVPDLNSNTYMDLSRVIYEQGMDNDIIDDASIQTGTIQEGKLVVDDNEYRALIFGPEATMRRTNLQKALELVRSGGTVLFYGQLPVASTEKGRHDAQLDRLLEQLLGTEISSSMPPSMLSKNFEHGGFCAFIPGNQQELADSLSSHIHEDVKILNGNFNYSHRQAGNSDIYLFQNRQEHPTTLHARLRSDGVPEHWNLFTGTVEPVDGFERNNGHTTIKHRLEGNTAELIMVRPGKQQNQPFTLNKPLKEEKLPNEWQFSVIPTRDNQWGSFRWPPSDRIIGPEVRSFHYRKEEDQTGTDLGWHRKTFDHADWDTYRYDSGPYWLTVGPISSGANRVRADLLKNIKGIEAGDHLTAGQKKRTWKTVVFSQKLGRRETIGGRPDGAIDPNFVNLPDGHRFLFTRLRSPRKQLLGLQVKLRSNEPNLWVNGTRQPFRGTVGKLPLQQGINTVLLEIPNGGRGSLYVQSHLPEDKNYKQKQAHPDLGSSIDLPSPYLQSFRQHPNVRYDVKPRDENRVGWYRFKVPPGTRKLKLPNQRGTRAWLDGKRVPVRGNEVILNQPAKHTSTMALRVSMKPGAYAGAAFPEPIRLVISEGTMTLGDWTKRGLPTYSGIGTYKRSVRLTAEQAKREIRLRLGKVRVAAEVFVNGTSAGVRVARPFRFNLTGMVKPGKNKISVHVANTLGPEYKAISPIVGPTASGLFGPVKLRFYRNE